MLTGYLIPVSIGNCEPASMLMLAFIASQPHSGSESLILCRHIIYVLLCLRAGNSRGPSIRTSHYCERDISGTP